MSIVKSISVYIVAIAASITWASIASAVTIMNGSFELPGPTAGSFETISAGSGGLIGWTVGGASVDRIGTYWTASDDLHSLDLGGSDAGSVTQTVTDLEVGAVYEISFDMAGNPDNGPTVKSLMASIDGYSGTFNFDITGKTRADMGWVTESFSFTASAVSQDLTFAATTTGPWGPALDSVSIIKIANVPVPGSLLFLGTAFSALGLVRARRRAAPKP